MCNQLLILSCLLVYVLLIITDQADASNRVAASNMIPSVNFQVLISMLILLNKFGGIIAWLTGENIYMWFISNLMLYGIRVISWFIGQENTVVAGIQLCSKSAACIYYIILKNFRVKDQSENCIIFTIQFIFNDHSTIFTTIGLYCDLSAI